MRIILAVLITLGLGWGWERNGSPIATSSKHEGQVKIVEGDSGSAIVVWKEMADGYAYIKAQKIGIDGEKKWKPEEGVLVSTLPLWGGIAWGPSIVGDNQGGVLVVFSVDLEKQNIRLQWVEKDGRLKFEPEGLLVSESPIRQKYPRVCLVKEGIWVTWQDYRYSDSLGIVDVFCNYVNSEGEVLTKDGIKVTRNTSGGESPEIVPSLDGDAIVLWAGRRPDDTLGAIFGQRISPTGKFKWDTLGILIEHTWYFLGTISNRKGGTILFFVPPGGGASVQCIDPTGSICWESGGIPIIESPITSEYFNFDTDSFSGSFISYTYFERGQAIKLMSNYLDSAGSEVWTSIVWEIPFPSNYYWHGHSCITNTLPGECIVGWDTDSDSASGDIWAARIVEGSIRWKVPICTTERNQINCAACKDEKGGAYLVWEDYRNDNWDIYGQHLDSTRVGVEEKAFESERLMVKLDQNYPNPFKGKTAIRFQLSVKAIVSLNIYDISGRLVKTLNRAQSLKPGVYNVNWDGKDEKGHKVSSGVYFYRLKVKGKSIIKKMVLIK